MMYILTQAEYDELVAQRQQKLRLSEKKLQDLCTKIAETMPIKWSFSSSGRRDATVQPWGCVLTGSQIHCDDCPVQEICPAPKDYSQ